MNNRNKISTLNYNKITTGILFLIVVQEHWIKRPVSHTHTHTHPNKKEKSKHGLEGIRELQRQ